HRSRPGRSARTHAARPAPSLRTRARRARRGPSVVFCTSPPSILLLSPSLAPRKPPSGDQRDPGEASSPVHASDVVPPASPTSQLDRRGGVSPPGGPAFCGSMPAPRLVPRALGLLLMSGLACAPTIRTPLKQALPSVTGDSTGPAGPCLGEPARLDLGGPAV